jgi:protein-L-isoaspartate O-methyltransferase
MRELHDELVRVDASIAVLERIETLSERARADLEALRVRRAEIAAALEALGGGSGG